MTAFLASNLSAGQHPKPQHMFLHQRKPLYWFPDQTSQLLHPTGNSALVLVTGKATLLPTFFVALYKQDSASESFKQQFF